MATSKSTVLGIRLDHDRRAWVEAEAARRGVSVRGLFEGMIDGARTDETGDAPNGGETGSGADYAVVSDRPENWSGGAGRTDEATAAAADVSVNKTFSVNTASSTSGRTGSSLPFGSSPWPDLGSVTALPGGLIKGAVSLTTGLIKTSGRCARSRVENCPLTRLWVDRSA